MSDNLKIAELESQKAKLKEVIDILIKTINLSLDENYTRRTVNSRIRESLNQVSKILGIAKEK